MSDPAQISIRGLSSCGCCAGVGAVTPVVIDNRPGLSAIAYRTGTQPQFKESMLAALSDASRPALQGLLTRAGDDFSIALIDAAATMADVLAFYQERIANESYLRTATERRSVLEMARLIGYELRPGVAAGAYLAFTIDETAGAAKEVPIEIGTKVQSVPGPGEKPQTFETVEKLVARPEWNALRPQRTRAQEIQGTQLHFAGVNTQLSPGDGIVIVGDERAKPTAPQDWQRWDFRIVESVTRTPEGTTLVTWEGPLASPLPTRPRCFAMRQRAKLFGNNAPEWAAVSDSVRVSYIVKGGGDVTSYKPLLPSTWGFADWPGFVNDGAATGEVHLDGPYPKIVPGSWVVLQRSGTVALYLVEEADTASVSEFSISSASTRLKFDTSANLAGFGLRDTSVFAQSEELTLAELPSPDVTGSTVRLDPKTDMSSLFVGQHLAVSVIDSATGKVTSEITAITAISGWTLKVDPPLAQVYGINAVTFNANVAPATQGETVREVLGNGDAGASFQTFPLKQSPLTYVPARSAGGADSTLEVRVNDVQWHEAPTLYGTGPGEHVFITRRDDAGNTGVQFGDGVTGARLPSGRLNVRARYRKGIGAAGNLKANQLSLLLSRPQGLKGATNPAPSSGGEDPEQLADARVNAPLTVLTLDRAVSLEDYEDFSRAFAGVAKANATWTWDGRSRRILITVAGAGGTTLPPDGRTVTDLVAALQSSGDPFVPVSVSSFLPVPFRVGAAVKVDPDYEEDKVLAAVEAALRAAFSFDAVSFGQAVYLSQVIELAQSVPGVVAVEVTRLYRSHSFLPSLQQALAPAGPRLISGVRLVGAELLTLDPLPLDLGVMS